MTNLPSTYRLYFLGYCQKSSCLLIKQPQLQVSADYLRLRLFYINDFDPFKTCLVHQNRVLVIFHNISFLESLLKDNDKQWSAKLLPTAPSLNFQGDRFCYIFLFFAGLKNLGDMLAVNRLLMFLCVQLLAADFYCAAPIVCTFQQIGSGIHKNFARQSALLRA